MDKIKVTSWLSLLLLTAISMLGVGEQTGSNLIDKQLNFNYGDYAGS